MSVIDLNQEPHELAKNIITVATKHRHPWIKEWTKNFRRLAAFTEDDVPAASNAGGGNNPTAMTEPSTVKYATSFNVTRNFFTRLVGRVMPALTRYQVLAATRDRDDRDAAAVGAKYLRSRTAADSGEDFEPMVRTVSYLFAGGPAYYRVDPKYAGNGFPGDVQSAAVMPTDVYAFPGILDLNESPAIVLRERLTQLTITERYPELAAMIEDWTAIPGAKWPDDVDLQQISPELDKGVFTVQRLMWRPTDEHKEGREFISIVGATAESTDAQQADVGWMRDKLDTYDGKYPLVTFADIPMGPFFEDRGRMTISSKMQAVLDIALSKILDLTLGGPQTIVGIPVASSITEDDFTNKAWMFYDKIPGQELSIDQAPGSGNLGEVVDLAMRFMGEVHAQHAPSRGQAGPRQSGKALEHMTQMDVAVDEPFLAMIRRSVARVGKRILGEARRMLPKDFNFAAMGQHQRHQMESFRATNLRDGFDVRVMPGGALPDDKEAKAQLVIKGLGDVPLFSDDPSAIRARELLGIHVDGEEAFEVEQEQVQIIRQEDELIAKGQLPERMWSDNDTLHMAKHKDEDIRRRSLGPVDPLVTEMAQGHYEAHQKAIDDEMRKQMQMQMQAQQPPA